MHIARKLNISLNVREPIDDVEEIIVDEKEALKTFNVDFVKEIADDIHYNFTSLGEALGEFLKNMSSQIDFDYMSTVLRNIFAAILLSISANILLDVFFFG